MSFKLKFSHQFIIIWLSLSAFLHNILMNGANNVIISSIQKEFYLSSRETGIYVSVYDIGSLLSTIFVSFASARGSKPRWIAFGMVMLFIGCMVNVLPHFLKPNEYETNLNTHLDHTLSNDLNSPHIVNNDNVVELCNHSLSIDHLERYKYFRRNLTANDLDDGSINISKGGQRLTSKFGFSFQLKHLLYAANIINGMSSASMTTITFSYIEDFAPKHLSSIYESIYYAVGAFGVGVGFMITSKCLTIHTDIDRISKLPSWLKPSHPNWIGAWWLPFLIFGFVAFILAAVIFIFPRKFKKAKSKKANGLNGLKQTNELVILNSNNSNNRSSNGDLVNTDMESVGNESDLQNRNYETNTFLQTLKETGSILSINKLGIESNKLKHENNHELVNSSSTLSSNASDTKSDLSLIQKSLKLVKKPVYLFVIIAAAIEGLLQNSFLAFASLFLEYQYRLASGSASLILGLLSIPPLMIGGLLSGYIVNRLNNNTKKCFKFLAIVLFINIIVYAGFMIYCKESTIVSNNDYETKDNMYKSNFTVAENCNCNKKLFKPVCLKNSQDTFFQSACLAGCFKYDKTTDSYSNCTQVDKYLDQNETTNYFENGFCQKDSSCFIKLVISYTCIFLLMFLNALTFLPYLKVTIGCINAQEMNSIGLGMKQFFMNAFGTIPGPILFGSIIDSTCIYWHNDLNDQSVCKMYNNRQFAFGFGMLGVGFKTVCFLLIILSLMFLKKQNNKKELITNNETK